MSEEGIRKIELLKNEIQSLVKSLEDKIKEKENIGYFRSSVSFTRWTGPEVLALNELFRKYLLILIEERKKEGPFDIDKEGPEFFDNVVKEFFTDVVKAPFARYYYDMIVCYYRPSDFDGEEIPLTSFETHRINNIYIRRARAYVDDMFESQRVIEETKIKEEYKSKTTIKEKQEMARFYITPENGLKLGDNYRLLEIIYGEAMGGKFDDDVIRDLPLEDRAMIYYMDMLASHSFVQNSYKYDEEKEVFTLGESFNFDSYAEDSLDSGIESYRKYYGAMEYLGKENEEYERIPIEFAPDITFEDAKRITMSLFISGQFGVVGLFDGVEIRPKELLDKRSWKRVSLLMLKEEQGKKGESIINKN